LKRHWVVTSRYHLHALGIDCAAQHRGRGGAVCLKRGRPIVAVRLLSPVARRSRWRPRIELSASVASVRAVATEAAFREMLNLLSLVVRSRTNHNRPKRSKTPRGNQVSTVIDRAAAVT